MLINYIYVYFNIIYDYKEKSCKENIQIKCAVLDLFIYLLSNH